jgi:subtilisin family serine protease
MDSLIEDMIEADVVVVAAAGNSFYDIRIPTSDNYNFTIEANLCNLQKENPSIPYEDSTTFAGFLPGTNYINLYPGQPWGDNIYNFFPFQGSSPGSASGVITVGSMSYECCPEIKSSFSNSGKRIDIYAPGSQILSSAFYNAQSFGGNSFFCNHPKDNRFGMSKLSGTSMASPQVCGAIASYLTEGNVQRSGNIVEQVTQWIKDNSIPTLSNGSFPHDLHEGTNKILYFPNITVRY